MTNGIEIKNLTKSFGHVKALEHLDLEIKKGEIFAFLGPNGAGKTTTIKLLCGLLSPDEGDIYIAGNNLKTDSEQAKRIIGLIPDEPYLYAKLTAWEFLALIARIYELDPGWREEAKKYFDIFEIAPDALAHDLLEGFSHGMRQKVVFTSALIRKPGVWLLDEPLVGLDPKAMREVKKLLKQKAQAGAAIFLCTHILSIAEELAHRIGIVQHGKLEFVGTTQELKSYLKNKNLDFNEGDNLEELFLKATLKHNDNV
ncbi:ABC transporter ATP-binding protein [Elusimicrobiota bacterium]